MSYGQICELLSVLAYHCLQATKFKAMGCSILVQVISAIRDLLKGQK